METHTGTQFRAPPPPAPPAPPAEKQEGVRREVFGLEEGEVVIVLPARMSAESISDVEDWLEIITRKLRRVSGVAPRQGTQASSPPAAENKVEAEEGSEVDSQ